MPVLPVESLHDDRLTPYRMIRDREVAQRGDLFIAEGEHVTRRLLASDFPVHSLLLAQRRVADIAPLVPPDVPIYAAADELINATLGYKFHSGVMACGRRKSELTLDHIVASWQVQPDRLRTLLICPQVINHDNLGSLIRIAAAFGVPLVSLFGPTDPKWTTIPHHPGGPEVEVVADPTLPASEVSDDHPERCRIDRIETGVVWDAVERVLASSSARA